MKNKKEKTKPIENNQSVDSDEKLDINKSVFQTSREIQEQQRRELEEKQAELMRQHEERKRKNQEAYDKRILEEKKELMRLKQGIIEESEVIHEEEEEPEVKRSLGKRISSFFYLNKWWLGIGTFFVAVVVILCYSYFTKPKIDSTVLFVQYNAGVGDSQGLRDYLTQFASDNNGDGKVKTALYYIPFSENEFANYQTGADSKMTLEFQRGDAVIVFGAERLDEYLKPAEESLMNLEEMFPDNPHVKGYKFMLKGTPFAERIGVEEQYITDDLYLAIRKPMKLYHSSLKEMQQTYDNDIELFKAMIDDLTE